MGFDTFKERVNALIARAGGGISVEFHQEDGKMFARCSEGTVIEGNSVAHSVKVSWGSGHTAIATF